MERKNAVIVAFGRSAIAKAIRGSLRYTGCADFGTQVLRGILERNPGFDPALAEDLICGCAIPEAEQGLNIGRLLADSSGFPLSTAGQTVNRFCASGLQSIASAANAIMAGQARCIVAGGLENMSKVQMHRVAIIPDSASFGSYPDNFDTMGITAENVAERWGISRQELDEFSARSQQKCARAMETGRFKDEIVPVTVKQKKQTVVVDTDEGPRPTTTVEILSKLKPAFKPDGVVTAGNSSGINDGAAAVVLLSEEKARELGVKPMARFVAGALAGVDPAVMGVGPVAASQKAMAKAGLTVADFDLIEANEAFAAQSVAVARELHFDPEKLNVNGGAIALGHPVGASGCRILVTLLHEMQKRDAKKGLATLCIGGGMGCAAIVERD